MPTIQLSRTPQTRVPFLSTLTRDMEEASNRLRRAFSVPLAEPLTQPLGYSPAVEIAETPEEFTVTAELPGLSPKEIQAEFDDGVLTLRGEKTETRTEKDRRYHVWERAYGAFERSFTFPRSVDKEKITAAFDNGVLTLHLPKTKEEKNQGKKIEIGPKV